jgi:hypothetical protein
MEIMWVKMGYFTFGKSGDHYRLDGGNSAHEAALKSKCGFNY